MSTVVEHWRAFWFAPARPTNLAIWRIVFYGTTLLFYGGEDVAAWATVPEVFWHPIRLFGVVHLVVLPESTLHLLSVVWAVALAASCIGLFTRASTIVAFVIGLYLIGLPHNFGKVHHGDALTVFMLGILACSRCGDGWSIDRLVALVRRPTLAQGPRSSGEYTWPLRLGCVLITLVFLGAGTSKLRQSGLRWITSDNMANMLVNHHYSHHPPVRWSLALAPHRWLTSGIAAMTVLLETAAPLALFSRWLRVVLIPSLFLMQVGIWLLMGILFRDFLVMYLVWVPWDRLGDWIVGRWAGRPTYAVLYDGSCGLCRRTMGVVRALDPLRRVAIHDVHGDWPEVARRYPHLSQETCMAEMHVVAPSGRITLGFDGYRALAWTLPAAWLVLPLLYLPGVRWVGRRVYARVAARRACSIAEHRAWAPAATPEATGEPAARR